MFHKFIIICLILFLKNGSTSGQATLPKTCTTPNQASGICTSLNSCSSLLNLLLTQNNNNTVRDYLRASVCEFTGTNPIVCCPVQNSRLVQKASLNVTKLPLSPNCGFSNDTTPRIVNGVPAKLGEFPWIAALGYRNPKNPEVPRWLCGGSLITQRHILTAAHCVYNRSDLYLARLGDLDLFSNDDGATPSSIAISEVKIHNNFNPTKFSNDIAILTLKESMNNPTVWPICLPINEPLRTMSYLNFSPTLAGWGSVTFNGPSSATLQQIFVPVLNNQVCERTFGKSATIDSTIICAGSLNGDKDACGGDSGGPLMHEINEGTNNRVYQIGIVSYGFRCAVPGYPGVYTRVTSFINWIQENLN